MNYMQPAGQMLPAIDRPDNRPCGGLLLRQGRKDYLSKCVPLYQATMLENWDAAKVILDANRNLEKCSITENQETVFHISAMTKRTDFMEKLMDRMETGDLYLQNADGNTGFCLAAIGGNIKMVKTMTEHVKGQGLLTIRGSKNMTPLYLAALYGNHEVVIYLYGLSERMSSDFWTDEDRNMVFLKCIEADLFDVALKILNDGIEVPQGKYVSEVLHALAQRPYAFDDIEPHLIWKTIGSILGVFHLNLRVGPSVVKSEATQLLRIIWEKIVVRPRNEIEEILKGPMIDSNGMQTQPSDILFMAAEKGNVTFLVELISEYPDLLWKRKDNGQGIFHVAVAHRRERVYTLLKEIGSMKDMITPLIDKEGNNMLHLVGMNPQNNPYKDSLTAPLQMQRELLWHKEVKDMIPLPYREVKNIIGQTPSELFTKNHNDLVSESKKWLKGTTNQCMVAAVLIATIGFSVVCTVPGGYDQQNGFPQFLHDGHLVAFVIFNAISFILSSISLLMFLSIVVSRYTQTDFLESLPQKLTIGLATLFLSILTMMIAFGVSFFILYHHKLMLIPFLIWALGSIPVILYSKQQYPLLKDVLHSRYGSGYLFKAKRQCFFKILGSKCCHCS